METLSPQEERRLLDGVKQAVDLIERQGLHPNQALAKVARDNAYSPGYLRAAVSALNNGRQLAQWRENTSVLDKLASFELADYDAVCQEVWGAEKHAAVHRDYLAPPAWQHKPLGREGLEKAAADLLARPEPLPLHPAAQDHQATVAAQRAYGQYQRAKIARDEARRQESAALDRLAIHLRLLDGYFKKAACDRLPFALVEDAVATYHGQAGRLLMDYLALGRHEKRAADTRLFPEKPLCRQCAPFTFVDAAVKAAGEANQAKAVLVLAEAELTKAAEAVFPFVVGPPSPNHSPTTLSTCLVAGWEKESSLGNWAAGSAVATTTRELLERAISSEQKEKDIEKQWTDLTDPDHENQLRKIRIQAMLTGMMADPENPISGYDPDRVLSQYNELAQLAPRTAEQPAAIEPLLARRLSGRVEPFEVREVADIEKGLRDIRTKPTPSLFAHANP